MIWKRPIYASILARSFLVRANTREPYRFRAWFEKADGLAAVQGREVQATMDGHEVAGLLGAIPARLFDDTDEGRRDFAAVTRVMKLLHRLGDGEVS